MPKVVSRSAISSSKDDSHLRSTLKVFFCICGEFALVCDRSLDQCPSRPVDKSHILRVLDSIPDEKGRVRKARVFKLNAKQAGQRMLKRPDGSLEKQYRFNCTRCDLPLGYEHTPPPIKSGNKFVYIFKGSVSEVQGQVPDDVFFQDEADSNEKSGQDQTMAGEQEGDGEQIAEKVGNEISNGN